MNSNLFLRLVDEPPSLNYKTYTEGDPEGRYIEWPVNPQSRSLFVPLCTLENVRTFPKFCCPHLSESKLKFGELEGKVRFTAMELMEERIRMTMTSSQRT